MDDLTQRELAAIAFYLKKLLGLSPYSEATNAEILRLQERVEGLRDD